MNESRKRRLRDRTSDAATLINEGCKVSGLITGSGDYLINGEIDGDCDLSGTVTLARNGLWKGTIKASPVTSKATSRPREKSRSPIRRESSGRSPAKPSRLPKAPWSRAL